MKIRIKDNSIRLRLTKSEVEVFCKDGQFNSSTSFPSNNFKYSLIASEEINQLQAEFSENSIVVKMPMHNMNEWRDTDKVGFTDQINIDGDQSLKIKVEKDFVCLDETDEDQSDNYANPRA